MSKSKKGVLKLYHATHVKTRTDEHERIGSYPESKREVMITAQTKKKAIKVVEKEFGEGKVILSRLTIHKDFAQILINAENPPPPTINHGV